MKVYLALLFAFFLSTAQGSIQPGIDVFLEEGYIEKNLLGKKVGLITNQSAWNSSLKSTFELLKNRQGPFKLSALFAPEHGFYGDAYAYESIEDKELDGIPLYGLHGSRRRPTLEMLSLVDVLIYDIQDIGARSYTFASTLFYCMEEAAKNGKEVIVLDRPNPMGGLIVDGPLIEENWRSFLGYIKIPYCHGMTIGELARLFNEEYDIQCKLTVVPMKGWKRSMTFAQTGLFWVPTSPQIPESDTAFFYPATGLLGHLSIVNIGIGYTLPFKLLGAPWIDAHCLSSALNAQNLPGIFFQPYFFRPFYGKFKGENCQGVRLVVTDSQIFLPMTTQYTILGVLKSLYNKPFKEALACLSASTSKKDVFHKLNGSDEILNILQHDPYIIWKLREKCREGRESFLPIRKKYLFPQYS